MFGSSQVKRDGSKLKAIDSILSGLGELPVSERVTQLSSVISTLESMSLPARKRIQLLESCRDPVLAVAEDTRQSCIVQSLPLGDMEFKRVKVALELLARLSKLYAQPDDDLDKNKRFVRLAVHRELELWENYLVMAALAYIPLPENFWHRIHATMRRADTDGLVKFKPSGADNRLSLSTGQIYVALVLIGQSDPYQLGFREVLRVREVATLLANRVDLITDNFQPDPERRRYVFLVDDKLNQPAMPWGTGREGRLPEGSIVLDITDVVTRLRRTYRSLRPDEIKFDATFPDEPKQVIMTFYEHLLTLWAKQPIRGNERQTKISGYQLCIGLEDMLALPAYKTTQAFGAPTDEIILSGGLDAETVNISNFVDARSHDISSDGIRFVVNEHTPKRIAAGEAIGYCLEEQGIWMAGLIRWVKGPGSGKAEFGVMVLGEFSDVALIEKDTSMGIPEAEEQVEEKSKAVLVKDLRRQSDTYWVIESASGVEDEGAESTVDRVVVNNEVRSIKPLNRKRRTPFVEYQYVEMSSPEPASAAAQR